MLVTFQSHLRFARKVQKYGDAFSKSSSIYIFGVTNSRLDSGQQVGPPGVLGIWGEWLFIFRELGSTGNYFMGAREQAHNFGDLGSLAKKQKNKEKPSFCLIFKKIFCFCGASPQDPPPL